MRCRFRKPGEISSDHDCYESVTAWEQTVTIEPADADSRASLPFEYQLPEVGPLARLIEPAASGNKPYFRMKASFTIPGIKKTVITRNTKPDRRSWWLEVTAPTRDGRFQVPVAEGS